MQSSKLTYISAVDGLRALAVFLVLCHHWLNYDGYWGPVGVDIFFVISGFLITQILISYKSKIEEGMPVSHYLKIFYLRRFYRIFPIYYLFLLLIYLLAKDGFGFPWLIAYLSNFNFELHGFYALKSAEGLKLSVQHTWSLAVEEQFYLVWPLLLFLVPRNKTLWLILSFILIGTISQCSMNHFPGKLPILFTTNYFDDFGYGGLLAYFVSRKIQFNGRLLYMIFLTGIATTIVLCFARSQFYTTPLSVATCCLLAVFLQNPKSVVYQIFDLAPFRFFGKISYGVYLYHMLVYDLLVRYFGQQYSFSKTTLFLFSFIGVTTLSYLSYKLIELPIMRLKPTPAEPVKEQVVNELTV